MLSLTTIEIGQNLAMAIVMVVAAIVVGVIVIVLTRD